MFGSCHSNTDTQTHTIILEGRTCITRNTFEHLGNTQSVIALVVAHGWVATLGHHRNLLRRTDHFRKGCANG